MANKFTIFVYNLINDPNTLLSASSEDIRFPATNLRDPRLSRKWKATNRVSEWIKLDCSSVAAPLKSCTHFLITVTNLTLGATITIEAHPTDDFTSPDFTTTKTLVADPDTDPDTYGETMIVLSPYKTHCFALGSDILSANNFIRVVIEDPDSANPIRIAKMFLGWGLQWNVNYFLPWVQRFGSRSSFRRSSARIMHAAARQTHTGFTMNWAVSPSGDHTKARYLGREFGSQQPLWIALEPEHTTATYARDGVRAHGMSYYGHGHIGTIRELASGVLSYAFVFEEDVTSPFGESLELAGGTPTIPPEEEFEFGDFIGVVLRRAAVEAASNNANEFANWDTEDHDPHAMHAAGSTDSTPVAGSGDGVYGVVLAGQAGAGNTNNANETDITPYINGNPLSFLQGEQCELGNSGKPSSLSMYREDDIDVGDLYKMRFHWGSLPPGTTKDWTGNFQMWRIVSNHSGIAPLTYAGAAYNVSMPTVASGSWTPINSTSKIRDTHSNSVVNGRFTAPITGWYRVWVWEHNGVNAASSGKATGCRFLANGSSILAHKAKRAPDNTANGISVYNYTQVYLLTGEYVDYYIYHNYGVNAAITGQLGWSLIAEDGYSTILTVTNQSITSHATDFVPLQWGTTLSPSSDRLVLADSTKLKALEAGQLELFFNGKFAANATGERLFELRKNGSMKLPIRERTSPAEEWGGTLTFIDHAVSINDSYEIYTRQDSGSALNCSGRFGASYVGLT